jgi:hypothetical protein
MKVKLIIATIFFAAFFAMNGRQATKSEGVDVTLFQIIQSNAGWSESNYPCGTTYMCSWSYDYQVCTYLSTDGPLCYCYCGA